VIDCHVHLAAFSDGENGCYISPTLLSSPLFRFLSWKHGLSAERPSESNRKYVEDLLTELRRSRYVQQVVLLGMDGVYDASGRLDEAKTNLLVGNDYVMQLAAAHPQEFLAGVSINPQRRDAVEELERCAASGAVLVKVLPNAQGFDPGDRRYAPFYRALARLQIPLLSHVGYEFSLIGHDQSVGDPNRLRTALDEGTTVIAAHGCSHGTVFSEPHYETFLEMVTRYPNFFADVSALTLPNRVGMLWRLRRHPETHARLLFGTDYPLSVYGFPGWGRAGMQEMGAILRATNRFDKQYLVLLALGVGVRSFGDLLRIPA